MTKINPKWTAACSAETTEIHYRNGGVGMICVAEKGQRTWRRAEAPPCGSNFHGWISLMWGLCLAIDAKGMDGVQWTVICNKYKIE